MQIPPLPPVPVNPGVVPQDAVGKVLPQVQAQAAAPIIQRAVDPSKKSNQGGKSRNNEDRRKGGDSDTDKGGRGSSVNIRV